MLALCMLISPCDADIINWDWVNYGVLFESQKMVYAVYDYWTHTFKIEFPEINDARHDLAANGVSKIYKSYTTLNEARIHYMDFLNQTIVHIKKIVLILTQNQSPNVQHLVL